MSSGGQYEPKQDGLTINILLHPNGMGVPSGPTSKKAYGCNRPRCKNKKSVNGRGRHPGIHHTASGDWTNPGMGGVLA